MKLKYANYTTVELARKSERPSLSYNQKQTTDLNFYTKKHMFQNCPETKETTNPATGQANKTNPDEPTIEQQVETFECGAALNSSVCM